LTVCEFPQALLGLLARTTPNAAANYLSVASSQLWENQLPPAPAAEEEAARGATNPFMQPAYGDEKVANRGTRVWHFVIEKGP
jgi:hypothetical protein